MPTTVVFDLIDALVAQCKAQLAGIIVSDSYAITQDPGSYLMIGIDDPDAVTLARAADSRQEWAALGALQRDDNGSVHCVAESWNGDGDPKKARDDVKATLDGVAAVVNGDPTLGGVSGLLWTGYGASSTLTQAQTSNGAIARMAFTIAYRARIQII